MTSEQRKYKGIEDIYAIEDEMFSRSKGDVVISNFNAATVAVPTLQAAAEAVEFDVARQRIRRSLWMIEELEHAVQLVPNDAERCYCLGLIQIMTGRFEEAIKNLSQAIKIAPNHIAALHLFGEINLRFARYEKAAAAMERVVSQEPDNMTAISGLCVAYYCLGKRGKELARQSILQVIDPDLVRTLVGES